MLTKATNIISKVDILGLKYKLRYKGDSSYKTCTGGLLTIILTSVTLIASIFFGREVIERKNPIITSSKALADNSQITLKQLGFHFMLADSDSTVLHTDPNFMKGLRITAFVISFGIKDNNPFFEFDQLVVENCKEEFFEPEYWAVINEKDRMKLFLCINPNKFFRNGKLIEEEPIIRNEYAQLDASSFHMKVALCDKKQDSGCDEWIQKENDFFIQSNFANYFFDGSKGSPMQATTKSITTLIGSAFAFIENVSLVSTSAIDDKGALFEINDDYEFHSFGEKRVDVQIFDPNNPNMYDITFDIPKLTNTISRRYLKIQEVLANVGGFIKAVFLLFQFFNHFLGEFWFFIDLKDEFHRSKKPEDPSNQPSTLIRINKSAVGLNNEEKTNIEQKRDNLSFWEHISCLFSFKFGSKHKTEKENIYKYFDIQFLMCSLIEQERLKGRLKSNAN